MVDIGSGVPPRILICDNEVALRGLVRAALDTGTYDIYEARDGDESLTRARELRPDLIVLDMMMPGRTGLEVLQELRTDPGFEQTPVVMLTARAQASDREEAERAGATHFVTKPFSPLKLASIVAELVERAA
jgi:CheY-like chemotaxis protein